jgi:hypothetical protein
MPDDFEEFDDDAPRRPRRVRDDDRPRRRRRDDDDEGDATGGVIPYKNGTALAAYYCGVFSFIPGLGCLLGPVAIVLGVMGVLYANKYPKAKGKGHAIAGIVLGLVGPFFVGGAIALFMAVAGK